MLPERKADGLSISIRVGGLTGVHSLSNIETAIARVSMVGDGFEYIDGQL